VPKLILLDAGGVLTTNQLPALFQQMAEEIDSDPDELLETYRAHLRTHLWSGGEDESFFLSPQT
jgi:hypothetical protein